MAGAALRSAPVIGSPRPLTLATASKGAASSLRSHAAPSTAQATLCIPRRTDMPDEQIERKMFEVEVGVTQQRMIRLAQGSLDDEQVIVLHPSQVEAVCKWILEVRDEILSGNYAPEP